MHKKLSHP